MSVYFNELLSDKIVRQSVFASLLVLVLTFLYISILYNRLPPYIPVFNQLPWGFGRIADKITIFLPPLLAMVLFVGNMVFSQITYSRMPLVARMISITTFFICVITCIFVIRTTLLIL